MAAEAAGTAVMAAAEAEAGAEAAGTAGMAVEAEAAEAAAERRDGGAECELAVSEW